MAVRTTVAQVKTVLRSEVEGTDWDSETDLTPFIAAASLIVDRVVTCATNRGTPLTSTEAEMIERWLSAHVYVQSDQNYASESSGGASGSYQGQTGKGIEGSKYGLTALAFDYSGCLRSITMGVRASLTHLGKLPRERIPYDQQ